MRKFSYVILLYMFFFALAYVFASQEQRQTIVQIMIYLLITSLVVSVLLVIAISIRWLFKDQEYQPNENGDFPIIKAGGVFSKQYINLNAIGTTYVPGQDLSLKDFQAMALYRFTSGKFGTPPASIFNDLNPIQSPEFDQEQFAILPPKIITPDELHPPLLLEAKNVAQEL